MINAVNSVQYTNLAYKRPQKRKADAGINPSFGSFSSVTSKVGFWTMIVSLATGVFSLYPTISRVISAQCALAPINPLNLSVAKYAGIAFLVGVLTSFVAKAVKS